MAQAQASVHPARWRFAGWPIRRKLLAMVLLPLLVVLPLLGLVLLVWGNAAFNRLMDTKVRADLAVARGYFDRVLVEVAASTGAVADSARLQAAMAGGSSERLHALLLQVRSREALDFIQLRDARGRLLASDARGLSADGADEVTPPEPAAVPKPEPAPARTREVAVLQWGSQSPGLQPLPAAGVQAHQRATAVLAVLSPDQQGLLSPQLREQVAVPLLSTRNAAPTPRTVEDRAMVVQARSAVRSPDGRLLGWLEAGVLLNRNLPFIDHINAIVYPEGSLPFGSRGTATLFLDDVRVSTNVRLFEQGEVRAIGTRVSQAVRDAVLEQGRPWLGRAFVVSDWYVSAYDPLLDAQGRRVGMLYVGFLERPFVWVKYGVLAGIGLVFFGVMIGAALWSARQARQIFRPVEQMAHTMARVEGGALEARVGALASRDELGALAGHLDHLLDTLAAQTDELRRWNAELDAKVAERGLALAATQRQLVRTEKMAAVGQLTASIAHEVNNPIAVIQGNLDLARELLGEDAAKVRDELALVDAQIERMRLIVTQLLQFARPTEYAGYVESVDPAQAFGDCLVLTRHLLERSQIGIERHMTATHSVGINRQELQQVLVNLMVNALQAMPDGGTLTLATTDVLDPQGRAGARLDVLDTGPGFGASQLAELFQPFVTGKAEGTGLGLWISRSIVERYGGDLRAANRSDGPGAWLSVHLLCEPVVPPDAGPPSGRPGALRGPAIPEGQAQTQA